MPFSGIIEAQASSKITIMWPVRDSSGKTIRKSINTHDSDAKNGHQGIDLSCKNGDKYYCAYTGQVYLIYSGCKTNAWGDHSNCKPNHGRWKNTYKYDGDLAKCYGKKYCNDGCGNGIVIKAKINGKTYYFHYCHMKNADTVKNFKTGQTIQQGTYLGEVGNTGFSDGLHAHFNIDIDSKNNKNTAYIFGTGCNDPTHKHCQFNYVDNAISYKVEIKDATNVTANSATINAKANVMVNPEKCHYYISTNYNYLKNLDTTTNTYAGNTKPGMPNSHTSNANMDCFQLFPDNANNPPLRDTFSTRVDKYKGKTLEQNKTYYYKMSVKYAGKWYQTGVKSFTTKSTVPGDAKVTLSSAKDIGIGDTAVLTWNAASNTKSYSVKVYNSNNVQVGSTIDNITTLGCTVPATYFTTADTYTFKVTAKNDYGSKDLTSSPAVTVHNNVKVSFVNDDDTLIEEQTIKYNSSATLPASPVREGYSFNKWEGEYKNVKTDSTVKAVYNKNSYTVKFFDGLSGKLLKTEKVFYKEAAHAPEVSDVGAYIFKGWDRDYSSITEDTTVTANYNWYNDNYPVKTVISSVSRNDNKDGYDISINITAGAADKTEGRIVVALMTESGFLLNTTESAAFSLRSNDSKSLSVFAPCNELAYYLKVFTINDYQKSGPIAAPVEKTIDNSDANWSPYYAYNNDSEIPSVGSTINGRVVTAVDTKKDPNLYRYRNTSVVKSYATTMSGYTKNGYDKIAVSTNQTQYYLKSGEYPANTSSKTYIDTGNALFKKYNNTKITAVDNDTTVINVGSESVYCYLFWQWAVPNYTANDLCNAIGDYKGESISGKGKATQFYMLQRSKKDIGWSSTYLGYNEADKTVSKYSKWWSGRTLHKNNGGIPVYTSTWSKYNKYYTYYKINDWTDWKDYTGNTVPVTAVDSATAFKTNGAIYAVENKIGTKYYRYQSETPFTTDDVDVPENQLVNVNQKVSSDFAGKEATVYIYKYTQPSDYTNEFIGTTMVKNDGTIEINNAKLREAPSEETGDFTIAVSIEGNSTMIVLDTIEAPKPTYTVTFYDYDKTTVLKTQKEVPAGATVYAPNTARLHPSAGYKFSHWNQSTANVQSDLIVYPEEEKETYKVIFVDWNNHKVSIDEKQYGDVISAPEIEESTEGIITTWNMSDATAVTEDGNTAYIVTKDTLITTDTEDVQCVVNFISPESVKTVEDPTDEEEVDSALDIEEIDENDIASAVSVAFSNRISTPVEIEENPDYIFYGWRDIKTGEYFEETAITSDATYYPVYTFAETTEAPIADIETGEYTENQTVTLTSETEDAVIYYTTDGSDPKTSDTAIEYTAPITIARPTVLNAYATSLGRNDSYIANNIYAINTTTSGIAYHLVSVYVSLGFNEYDKVYQAMIRDSRYFDDSKFDKNIEGFSYEGLFFDVDCTHQFYADEELIECETTLYAKYSPKTLNVTFKDYDGTVLSTVQHTYGDDEINTPTPTREGYRFLGWDVEDFSTISEDTVATARYCLEEEYATVSLNKDKARIIEGQQFTKLVATVSPENLENVELIWSSSDDSIALVDENGIVTAVGAGTATITVTVEATGESASCVFTILGDYNKSIVFGSNSFLNFDSEGYIRIVRPEKNTVSELLYQFENDAENLAFTSPTGTALSGDDLIGTSSRVEFAVDGEKLDEAIFVMTGDINGDGYIGNADVSMLSQWLVQTKELSYEQQLAADVNGDGSVDNKDAAVIQRYLVGKAEI